jgi:hypothetical protein
MGCLNERPASYRSYSATGTMMNPGITNKTLQTPAALLIKNQKPIFIIRPIFPKELTNPEKNATLGAQIKPISN